MIETQGSLQALHCPECNGAVPLGTADGVKCPFCNNLFEIPAEHRAMRDAERSDVAARQEAARAYQRFGRKPSFWLKLAAVLIRPFFLYSVGVVFALLAGFVIQVRMYRLVRRLWLVNLYDVLSARQDALIMYGLMLVILVLAVVIGSFGWRRIVSLRKLQSALAANPPERKGGPAVCRICGAPLEIAAATLGVRCLYCHADNLVAMPASWVAAVAKDAASVGAEIEVAAKAYDDERRRVRRGLYIKLAIFLGIAGGFMTVVSLGMADTKSDYEKLNQWPPSWRSDVTGERSLLAITKAGKGKQAPNYERRPFDEVCQPTLNGAYFEPDWCYRAGCRRHYYVALRHGEKLRMHTAAAGKLSLLEHRADGSWWNADDWGHRVAVVQAAAEQDMEVVAPRSAWYRAELRLQDAKAHEQITLCIQIVKP